MNRIILTALLLVLSVSASAETLAEYHPGGPNGVFGAAVGESVTTPGGGPWDHIAFNFFDDLTGDPYAANGLYVLSQAYAGTTDALNSSTAGYLGFTDTIDDGVWIFNTVLTLNPNTQYFFYMNKTTPTGTGVYVGDGYAGGIAYGNAGGGSFAGVSSADIQFRLTGDQVTGAPEPGTLALMAGAVGLLTAVRRRKA
jgi:hypothetical protein